MSRLISFCFSKMDLIAPCSIYSLLSFVGLSREVIPVSCAGNKQQLIQSLSPGSKS